VKTQSKVLNSLPRTPVYLQNSPKKRPFFLSILGQNSAVTALAIAVEELAPIFAPRVFRWKTGDLPFPAALFNRRLPVAITPPEITALALNPLHIFGI
jgi:hypothetical protein